jgi:hypothetical protein
VVVRVDLGRIRSVLGPQALESLGARTDMPSASADPDTHALVAEALGRADTAWLALRPGKSAETTDSVLVLRGGFQGLDPRAAGRPRVWGPGEDLGAGWRRHERLRAPTRGAPARLYVRADDLWVFVSTAPLDSVERRLELGEADQALAPASQGLLSLDCRPKDLGRQLLDRAPTVGRVLSRAERLRVTADLDAQGLRAELELTFVSAEAAREVAESLGSLASAVRDGDGSLPALVRGLTVEAVSDRVVLRLRLPGETVAALLAP